MTQFWLAYLMSSIPRVYKNTFSYCIFQNLINHDNRYLKGILSDRVLDCSLPPGQPSNSLDGYRQLGELKTPSQRNFSVKKRVERIQRDLEQNAKDLDARDPCSTVHAEMKSYGIEGRHIALVVGRFSEFSKDFAQLRDYIACKRAYAPTRTTSISSNRSTGRCRCSS